MKNKKNILQIYLGNQMIYVTGKIEDAKIVRFNNSKYKAMSLNLKGVKSLKPITSEEYETFSQIGLLNPNLSVNLSEGVYIYKIFDEIF